MTAHQAIKNLAQASPQDQHRVYELLDLHIAVTPQRTYEISGTIPTNGPLTRAAAGEVPAAAPRDP